MNTLLALLLPHDTSNSDVVKTSVYVQTSDSLPKTHAQQRIKAAACNLSRSLEAMDCCQEYEAQQAGPVLGQA